MTNSSGTRSYPSGARFLGATLGAGAAILMAVIGLGTAGQQGAASSETVSASSGTAAQSSPVPVPATPFASPTHTATPCAARQTMPC
jgi:hypothetical protein